MNIYESIAAIMSEGYAITKNKRNTQGSGFMYRGIDDVLNTFQPLLSKHKVFAMPEVLEQTREERQTKSGGNLLYSILRVRFTFYAEDGSSVSATVIGEAMDSGDKASNKAMSVAMKYAMFQTFCIPTEEMSDPDAETPPPSTPVRKAVAPKAGEPVPAPLDDFVQCENCGALLTTYTGKNGQIVSVEKHVAASRRMYGHALCLDCINKLKEAENA